MEKDFIDTFITKKEKRKVIKILNKLLKDSLKSVDAEKSSLNKDEKKLIMEIEFYRFYYKLISNKRKEGINEDFEKIEELVLNELFLLLTSASKNCKEMEYKNEKQDIVKFIKKYKLFRFITIHLLSFCNDFVFNKEKSLLKDKLGNFFKELYELNTIFDKRKLIFFYAIVEDGYIQEGFGDFGIDSKNQERFFTKFLIERRKFFNYF